jgi:hypothetical protein
MSRGAAALLVALSIPGLAAADPPARPTAFYVLLRAEPNIDAASLPAATRALFDDWRLARLGLRGEVERARRRDRMQALAAALEDAEERLRRHLRRGPFGAAACLLLGELELTRAERAYADEREPETEPVFDPSAALAAYRCAEAGPPSLAAQARYAEAIALGHAGREREAMVLLSIVAASQVADLAAEARFRLGEIAFEHGQLAIAAAWYERAYPELGAPLRPLAIYKRAWALYLIGRDHEALACANTLPDGAPDEMKLELEDIKLDIRMRIPVQ